MSMLHQPATTAPAIDWRSVACRMDDAHTDGAPLWSRLSPDEVTALCDVDPVPVAPALPLDVLAAHANVMVPESDTSPGAKFLRAVEGATTSTLDRIDGERAAAGLPVHLDDAAYDHHTDADLWPAVKAAIGDGVDVEAVAYDLGLQESSDDLTRAAFDLSSGLQSARW